MKLHPTGRLAGLLVGGAILVSACSGTGSTAAPASAPATPAPASQAPVSQAPASAPASQAASVAPSAAANATLPPPTISKDLVIGAAFPQVDTFLGKVKDGMEAETAALSASSGHKVSLQLQSAFVNGQEDVATQLSQVENMVSQCVDA